MKAASSRWGRRIARLWSGGRADADLREEMEAHRQLRQAHLERAGMAPDAAAQASRRAFGNATLAREDARDVWILRWLEHLRQDVRIGARVLLKYPAVTTTAILSLALGIGANAAAFSLLSKVVFEPLPFREPERLVMILAVPPNHAGQTQRLTAPEYLAWKRHATLFESMGTEGQLVRDLGADERGGPAERVAVQRLQADLFDVLGVQPQLGRPFRHDEEQVGAPAPVAMLSDAMWTLRFGRDRNVINKTIRLDGVPTTIIGVMPKGFAFLSMGNIDLFAPFAFNASQVRGSGRGYALAARLKPGVTMAQAQAEMDAIAAQVEPELPPPSKGWRARVLPMREALYGNISPALWLLQGIVGVVLLIACANVAGLLLARATTRRAEIAVRAAIGAGRTRIVRQLLTESALLAIAGAAAGLGVAWMLLRVFVAAGPAWMPHLQDLAIDRRVLLFALGAAIGTGLVFGTLPAIQASRPDLVDSLKAGSKGAMDGGARQRLRSAMVSLQVALAFVLLVGSGLLLNSFVRLRSNDLGGDVEHVVTFPIVYQGAKYFRPVGNFRGYPLIEVAPQTEQTTEQVLDAVKRLPGVRAAAVSSSLPFAGGRPMWPIHIEGRSESASGDQREATSADYQLVTQGLFAALKIPMTAGRDFDARDTATSPWSVVINEAMAKAFWPHENPLGQRLTVDITEDEQPREIIGVVRDFRASSYERTVAPAMFALEAQQPVHTIGPAGTGMRNRAFAVVRIAGNDAEVAAGIRRVMTDLDRDRPISDVHPLASDIAASTSSNRDVVAVVGFFGAVAVLLASVGIFGVMSHGVAQRTREIGVRMALGASRGDVLRLIMRNVLAIVAFGLAAGTAAALALTRFIAGLLWGVTPTDGLTFVCVGAVMTMVALLAGWIPTRRAMRIAPTVALKSE